MQLTQFLKGSERLVVALLAVVDQDEREQRIGPASVAGRRRRVRSAWMPRSRPPPKPAA